MTTARRQLAGIAALLVLAGSAWGAPEIVEPFGATAVAGPRYDLGGPIGSEALHVFFPRGPCESDHIQLQTWDRVMRTWSAHPEHNRVPVESCQVEDPGKLLNELRWRCEDVGVHNAWNMGLDVFDPAITESCSVGELRSADYRVDIHVSTPTRSHVVRSPGRKTTLRGSVRIDGVEGLAYDVLLVLDRSGQDPARGAERLGAQVRAAAGFIESMRPRLGTLRIGLASYPNPEPASGESHKGRLDLPLTTDADLLLRALERIATRGAAGPHAFADGLEYGLNQLLLLSDRSDRPAARRTLVLASDGHTAPFAVEDEPDPVLFMRLDGLAAEARRNGVRLQILALGGYAEEPTPLLLDFMTRSLGRFTRIPHSKLDANFFSQITLPQPSELRVISPLTGTRHRVPVDRDGHFTIEVPLEAGLNRLRLHARTSNDQVEERDWVVEYDESQYLELVLEAERGRLQRERARQRKTLDVRAEPLPEVGAGPPTAQ